MHYLKFSLVYLLALPQCIGVLLGGPWLMLGLGTIGVVLVVGDALLGDDTSTPDFRHPGWLNAMLYCAPLPVALVVLVQIWSLAIGDPLGIGAGVEALTGYDALSARLDNGPLEVLISLVGCGLLVAALGTIVAHELVHRTWHGPSVWLGKVLLAFSWDTAFAIEHVYGHHRHVATGQDPASAPRGRSVYRHIWLSTWQGNRSAWQIERQRLALRRRSLWSHHNRFLTGQLLSLLVTVLAFVLGGLAGGVGFLLVAAIAKSFLEIVNYMEHYGLVRVPRQQVQPRHSWNSNRRLSSWASFNLTRHSHHHATAQQPFHTLSPMADAPMMPSGYLSTILLTLVPPLWYRLMAPRLAHWDAHYASEAERALINAPQAT
ncbi:alkane 1-monooxygenase [Ferrimonas balearica]|uniref:alkane 1-monooxygenase n=1 Tax=Ferrimonas balearica TaxID=44012 RepID=UPI001F36ED23|nr:alkane 1-monooxygenase [Ferrimonas balearica]MBY6094102.1 alkane 1-monooxygenase [Ferrimonas balearica]